MAKSRFSSAVLPFSDRLLVHTRNIADPDYGTKLTGKTDEHAYGVMVANDNETTFLVPGNQGSNIAKLKTQQHRCYRHQQAWRRLQQLCGIG
jgi:hypothetical protein